MDTKICTNPLCPHHGKPQPLTSFFKQASHRDGLASRCRTCITAAVRAHSALPEVREARRQAHPYASTPELRQYKREWAKSHYAPRPQKPRQPRQSLVERFWSKVQKTDTCWLWTAGCDGHGYGSIELGGRNAGKARAHRVSWEFHNGPIPNGMCVLHKCDNPKCVRPDHLFLGTMLDNTHDMLAKGRNRASNGGWETRRAKTKHE